MYFTVTFSDFNSLFASDSVFPTTFGTTMSVEIFTSTPSAGVVTSSSPFEGPVCIAQVSDGTDDEYPVVFHDGSRSFSGTYPTYCVFGQNSVASLPDSVQTFNE